MEFDSPIEKLKERVKEKVGLRPEEQLWLINGVAAKDEAVVRSGQHICIRQGIQCPVDNTIIWYKSFSRHLMKQNKLKIKEEAKAMSRHANKYAIEDLEEWVAPLCPNSLVWGGLL